MPVATRPFGHCEDGREVHLYELQNSSGMRACVTDLGACLQAVVVPDGRGSFVDVTLGYDGAPGYLHNGADFGAIVGRNANRIAGASFELAGTTYHLAANDGPNSLHSGPHFWFERLWKLADGPRRNGDGSCQLTLNLLSRSGDQGFPGALDVFLTYRLFEDGHLELSFEAMPSATTIVNLTCHAYWNLNGHAAGSVLSHELWLDCDRYTPSDARLIPTGELADVTGTPYDFRSARALGRDIWLVPGGYDTNFVLKNDERVERVARLTGDQSGIWMDVWTDAPGLQLYTAGGLDALGKGGVHHGRFDGVALETQFFPDAIHHKNFPQPVYAPGHPFVSRTVFAFGHAER